MLRLHCCWNLQLLQQISSFSSVPQFPRVQSEHESRRLLEESRGTASLIMLTNHPKKQLRQVPLPSDNHQSPWDSSCSPPSSNSSILQTAAPSSSAPPLMGLCSPWTGGADTRRAAPALGAAAASRMVSVELLALPHRESTTNKGAQEGNLEVTMMAFPAFGAGCYWSPLESCWWTVVFFPFLRSCFALQENSMEEIGASVS